ncbi:MAG: hypothetical protein ACLQGP_35230 [Isosphaeraceae bacterium]
MDAYRRDRRQLLKERPGEWVAYRGSQRIGLGPTKEQLVQQCLEMGLRRIEFLVLPILGDDARYDRPVEIRYDPPPAKFERFERVMVSSKKMGNEHRMLPGTVLWRDYVHYTKYDRGFKEAPLRWWEWVYCIYFPEADCCSSFDESDIQTKGEFDPEEAHLGKRFDISFDTVLEEDNSIVEGCIRVPGRFWQIFYFSKKDVPELRHHFVMWPSGIASIEFDVPRDALLGKDYMIRALSNVFDTRPESWSNIYGPDSMILR